MSGSHSDPTPDHATGDTARFTPTVALKETCRVVAGGIPLWTFHRERLRRGGCGDELLAEADRAALTAATSWTGPATRRARLTLVVSPDGTVTAEVAKRLSSLDVPGGPVVARVDIAEKPPLPPGPAKPADRTWWDGAHRAARALGAHQAVIVDGDGNVVDGSTATVWIAENGVLFTPPSPPAVPGVSRAFVLAAAGNGRVETRVERVSWERFEAADEAFLTNAFGGVAAVRGRDGDAFEAVKALFSEAWGAR